MEKKEIEKRLTRKKILLQGTFLILLSWLHTKRLASHSLQCSYFVRHFGKTSLYMETTSTSMLALTQVNAMRSSRLYEWAALILAKGCFPYSDSCLLHSVCRGRGMQTHKCAYSLTIINIPKSDHQRQF